MPYPVPYVVTYSYTGFAQALGNGSFPGTQLDTDLAAFGASLQQTITFLDGITRSDGVLKNGIVTTDALDTVLAAAFGNLPAITVIQGLISTANADVVLTHADVVLTHADGVLTHADVVLTHADVVLTHADVVTTAANAATSTTQAGISTTQATNSSASAAVALAARGFGYVWSTNTAATDPGAGGIKGNAAPLSAITSINLSETDANANPIAAIIADWFAGTSANKATVRIAKASAPGTVWAEYYVTAGADNGAWDTLTVAYKAGAGVLANADAVNVSAVLVGDKGTTGATGANGSIAVAAAGGTADVITAAYTPVNGSLTDKLILAFVASAANATTTPTFSPDGLTARTIVKRGGVALAVGDIPGALAPVLVEYNLANTRWELLNPANYVRPDATSNLTAGYTATSYGGGSVTGAGQTYTPDPTLRNIQDITLNGSSLTGTFTFAAPASPCSVVTEVANGGAGAVAASLSTSGYTKVDGSWTNTNGKNFLFVSIKSKNFSYLSIVQLN